MGFAIALPAVAGVRRLQNARPTGPAVASESAALFVGIRHFDEDSALTEVRFAVDDAIDLAHLMAIELDPPLVDPKRAVLALSGDPQKPDSRARLDQLRAAKATIATASQADILKLLRTQSAAVGKQGLLIVSFATHGINDGGAQHLLTASSLLQDPETSITETKVRDIVARAGVRRALILIDACREQLTKDVRAGNAHPRSAAAALLDELGKVDGVVVLSAAASGQWAYDDETRGNGVFTGAVLDALRCAATTDAMGFVTVDALSRFVEENVRAWIRLHRDGDIRRATQTSYEGASARMPLSVCTNRTAPSPPPRVP